MKIDGIPYRSIWVDQDGWSVRILDQTKLPWSLEVVRLTDVEQVAHAIRTMQVRGAPLIGATAAYGICLSLRRDASTDAMESDAAMLARELDQLALYWFDGDAFWIDGALATSAPVRLPSPSGHHE